MGHRWRRAAIAAGSFFGVVLLILGAVPAFWYGWYYFVPGLAAISLVVFLVAVGGRVGAALVTGVALSVAAAIGVVIYVQTTGNGYTTHPRDGQVKGLVKGTWRDLGLDPSDLDLQSYSYVPRDDIRQCQHLPKDDRWQGNRSGSGPVERALRLEGRARSRLAGWNVERYQGIGAYAGDLLLRGTRKETALEITLSDDEVLIEAYAGPCAVEMTAVEADSRFWRRADR